VNRREAIRHATLAAGATLLGLHLPVRTWAALAEPVSWTEEEEKFFDLVGDTIIPTTPSSPGAGAVGIGRFIVTMASECYPATATVTLRRGMKEVQALVRKQFAHSFAELTPAQREGVLADYEKGKSVAHPSRLIKELTLRGYFTSEIGATQALRYVAIPGAFVGSVPLKKGDRSWAL
jgi:hypothetical protein